MGGSPTLSSQKRRSKNLGNSSGMNSWLSLAVQSLIKVTSENSWLNHSASISFHPLDVLK